MKQLLTKPYGLIAMMGIMLLSNAWVLGKVIWDRSRTTAELALSERELKTPYYRLNPKEDSSHYFRLEINSREWLTDDNWLTVAKKLGFCTEETHRRSKSWPEKSVYVALELAGPLFQAATEKARMEYEECQKKYGSKANEQCRWAENKYKESTRLFVADVSLDQGGLAAKYAIKNNYALLPGYVDYRGDCQSTKQSYHSMYVRLPEQIHVPKSLVPKYRQIAQEHSALDSEPRHQKPLPFSATLTFGRLLLPRVTALNPM